MNKKGFTIIELIIVIAVIAILAGIIIPMIGDVITDAKVSALVADYEAVFAACQRYKSDIGSLPKIDTSTNENVDPGFTKKSNAQADHQSQWKGPYLNIWKKENFLGGQNQYASGSNESMDRDGNLGNEHWFRVTGPNNGAVPDMWMKRVDEAIDKTDNGKDGNCHYTSGSHILIFLPEG